VSLTFHSTLRKLNTESSIGASHQISVHLAKQFQRRRFSEIYQLSTKLRFICLSGFREEEFKKSANQKQESSVAAMFDNGQRRNEQSLQRTFHRIICTSNCQNIKNSNILELSVPLTVKISKIVTC
jgi:hypothetical protein